MVTREQLFHFLKDFSLFTSNIHCSFPLHLFVRLPTEMRYLSNATSNIQVQLDTKYQENDNISVGDITCDKIRIKARSLDDLITYTHNNTCNSSEA